MYKQKIKFLNILLSLLFVLLLSINATGISNAQSLDWVDQFGSESADMTYDLDIDSAGNVYVAGTLSPVPFLRKEDSSGNEVWTRQFNLSQRTEISSIAVDNVGNIFVVGGTNYGAGGWTKDAFIRKYDTNGNLIWNRQFGFGEDPSAPGYESGDLATTVTVDKNTGYIYVGGSTNGIVSGQINQGKNDSFLRAYDSNGNTVWTREFGGLNNDSIIAAMIDSLGHIYAVGIQDAKSLLYKFDSSGNQLWSREFVYEALWDVAVDDLGNVYAGGNTLTHGDPFIGAYTSNGNELWRHELDGDGGRVWKIDVKYGKVAVGGYVAGPLLNQTYYGNEDSFVRVYDLDGNEKGTHQFGTVHAEELRGIRLIGSNSVVVAGRIFDGPIFPGETWFGNTDVFIAKISFNSPPNANAGLDINENEGIVVTLDGSASSDLDGITDIVSYSWNFGDGNTGSGAVVNHTYSDNGIYTATLTVTDSAGSTSTDTATVIIDNVVPTISTITAPLNPQNINTIINAGANFTDPGILDTHTAFWNWGDGTTSSGTVIENGGSGSVTGSHTYSTPGVYTLTLTITDKDGGLATTTFQYIVIYNPGGGFVTGGGWIDNGSGKVNFGFNSKYENGATVPTGQTQLIFKLADFNFHSTSYEWLIVSGSKAQHKGSGTVNGTGDYSFILTANDQPDKFRLKVWDKITGNVLYDTQPGDSDDADASTALGGGNVIIHN